MSGPAMETLYLIVQIAGQRSALPGGSIDSVVGIEAITPPPRVSSHIAGLAALRSRVLTMVDCRDSLGLGHGSRSGTLRTVIVEVDGHRYGLLVDAVVDVVTIATPPRPVSLALSAGWARATRGMVDHHGEPLMLIDPAALVAGPDMADAA